MKRSAMQSPGNKSSAVFPRWLVPTVLAISVALPEHALFGWVGALVTAAQHALAQLTPYGD